MTSRTISDESPLARLATRRGPNGTPWLSAPEAEAGERLRRDWTRGALMPSVTQRWDRPPGGGGSRGAGSDLGDAALDSRQRVGAALDAVGPELSGILVDVCCFLKGTEQVERERQWPVRSAKLLLKAGLGALARHYGLVHRAGEGRGTLRGWKAGEAGAP